MANESPELIVETESENESNDVEIVEQTEDNEVKTEHEVEEEQKSKRQKVEIYDDDDGKTCPICLDNWTNTGEHRLCALKCGHLFGHKCIMRWISSNKICPSCKKTARKHDVRFIFANKLIAVDATEIELLNKHIDVLVEEKNRLQVDLTQSICKQHFLQQEIDTLKRAGCSKNTYSSQSQRTTCREYDLRWSEYLSVCSQGTCRVMDIHPNSNSFVVSLKSSNPLFPCFGVKKYSSSNLSQITFIPLHSKTIRDLKFNHENSNMLSVSLDKTVKLYDYSTSTEISTVSCDNMLWSCCWDANNSNQFYAGEQQGGVLHFDMRNLNAPVNTLRFPGDLSPVVSLTAVPATAGTALQFGGLLVCKLNSAWAMENIPNGELARHQLPLDGPFISMCYNSEDNQFLISARPNARQLNMRHILCTLEKIDAIVTSTTIHTFSGGGLQTQLSRSCFLKNAGNQKTYIAAQNETSVMVCDVSSGQNAYLLRRHESVLDLMPLYNSNGSFLTALSGKKLELYKFVEKK